MAKTKVRIEINVPGFNEFRNSPEVTAAVTAKAQEVANAANAGVTQRTEDGDPFVVEVEHHATRVQAAVVSATFDGRLAEATDRVLSRAAGGE